MIKNSIIHGRPRLTTKHKHSYFSLCLILILPFTLIHILLVLWIFFSFHCLIVSLSHYLIGNPQDLRDASRNMTVTLPDLDTTIRYRWGGGMKLPQNFGGINELLHPGGWMFDWAGSECFDWDVWLGSSTGKFDWERMFWLGHVFERGLSLPSPPPCLLSRFPFTLPIP